MGKPRPMMVASGLDTNTSELQRRKGSLKLATNVRILRDGIIEPRRGYDVIADPLGGPVYKAFSYQGYPFAHHSNTGLRYYSSPSWVAVTGTFAAPSHPEARMRSAEAAKNLYFTTSAGVYKMDAFNATPETAGGLRGLDITVSINGVAGFLGALSQCAYRYGFYKKDANGNKVFGAVSGRRIMRNTAATAGNVDLALYLPRESTTSHFVTLYRSAQQLLAVEPSDEMGRVYEVQLTSTNITNGYVLISDIVTDDLRDATIYTAPSQEGILQNNFRPPLCRDIATFAGCMFFANTIGPQRFALDILAVGGSTGIANGDTIAIDGTTYTAAAVPASATEYLPETSLGSAALNNRATAYNLARTINQKTNTTNTTIYAYVASGPDDFVGKLVLEKRTLGAATFSVFVGTGDNNTCFQPILPQTAASTFVVSQADELPHGVYFSKGGQNEAVPLLNFLTAGAANKPLRRIIACRDSLFLLKDDGVFRITGTGPENFRVSEVDVGCFILGAETAQTLGDRVFCLSTQGVVAITESGAQVVSGDIEKDLLFLMTANSYRGVIEAYAWAAGYNSDHTYFLGLPNRSDATRCDVAFIYNEKNNTWTTDDKKTLCGFIHPTTDLLYLGYFVGADGFIYVEKKTRSATDYSDDNVAISTTIEFNQDDFGNPGEPKHFMEVVPLFTTGGSTTGTITVTFLMGGATEAVTLTVDSSESPRVMVPKDFRRGQRLGIRVSISKAGIGWQLLGVSVKCRAYGSRVNE